MWGCYVWSEMMERTNHFITTTMTIIRWVSSYKVTLPHLASAAPRVHSAGHRLHLHPLQRPPRRPHHRRHDSLPRHHGLSGLQVGRQKLWILHFQLRAHNHRFDQWQYFFSRNPNFFIPAEFLMVCNSSINFLLYVMFAPKFRMKVGMMWTNVVRSLSFSDQSKVNRSAEIIFTTCSQKF